ncbi:hypothetical protein J1605_019190 [Eschrichtius robustus]|uniref:Uncharacterized protein n=1 Tax=Eschrichtius robustus TaxID=9764 RepID=A0AB34HQN3_ESCRO|nr:hypothetical protein J1605_019190 [Eschrichtius robustus]
MPIVCSDAGRTNSKFAHYIQVHSSHSGVTALCNVNCPEVSLWTDLLEETHRKDEEMESLQDRVHALETAHYL